MSSIDDKFFDIYLWTFPENDKLIKINHLTHEEAKSFADRWHKLNEFHDYMLVVEGSTPFMDEPTIEIKTKEWFKSIEQGAIL